MRIPTRVLLLTLGLACAGGAAAGCGSTPASAPERVVHVSERDFQIQVRPGRLRAGPVRVVVRNLGPDRHELLMVRLRGGGLPLRRDGTTVDEEALQRALAAQLEPTEPGSTHVVEARLRPGRYVLFCNMEGHFLGGMSRVLVVGGRP